MSACSRRADWLGFTMIELIVVIAIAAILLAIAAPSFVTYLARQRLEGVMSELGTDMQLARSEAVARNINVRVTFGSSCYVLHTQPAGAGASSCSQAEATASTMGSNGAGETAIEIKTVKLRPGSNATLSPTAGHVEFDWVRGDAPVSTIGTPATALAGSTAGNWQLRVTVTAMGRAQVCSPGGSFKGYPTC